MHTCLTTPYGLYNANIKLTRLPTKTYRNDYRQECIIIHGPHEKLSSIRILSKTLACRHKVRLQRTGRKPMIRVAGVIIDIFNSYKQFNVL